MLFVFAEAGLPKDHSSHQAERYKQGQGGALTPLVCVDKPLDELSTYQALVEESKNTDVNWDIVLIACLSGRAGVMPNEDEAEQPLRMMVETIRAGGDLSRFVALDKQGEPILFE